MNKEDLKNLINRMSAVEETYNSEDTVSWKATREAENLTDTALLPILEEIITENAKPKGRHIRNEAYFIYGKILKNSFDRNGCVFFINRLTVETDKYILSGMLDRLADIEIPTDLDISPIILHTQSEKWLVRHAAIRALGSCSTQKSRDALSFFLKQEDEKKYKYEITYANAAMGKIGDHTDIPLLERHINSRIQDIKISAQMAIEKIKALSRT